MAEEEVYVMITNPAMHRFQKEILGHIERNYNLIGAIEIEGELIRMVKSLSIDPQRGALERWNNGDKKFRFLLYKERKFFEVKILYFVE
jgi:hypothetical protein